jgi:hypothetical protein
MKTEEQTTIGNILPVKQHKRYETPASERPLTWKQLRLAKFIAEEDVAEFEAVVTAIKNRQYKKVDEWKTEAGMKAAIPPRLDPVIADCLARQRARLGR